MSTVIVDSTSRSGAAAGVTPGAAAAASAGAPGAADKGAFAAKRSTRIGASGFTCLIAVRTSSTMLPGPHTKIFVGGGDFHELARQCFDLGRIDAAVEAARCAAARGS